ncbi:MAG: NAD-dependent epimerase/dehydratase family protein [bacterium]
MKILVTGGKGFVGKQLIEFLEKRDLSCVSYDLYDGEDLLDKKKLNQYVKKAEVIIHLAAIGDVYQVEQDPQNALIVGIIGTQNLIEVANKYPLKKIIYISTWEVYGEPQYEPIDENHPCNPDAPYSISKYGGELIVQSKQNLTPWIILRLGTIYGKHMRSKSVFSLFINRAIKNEPIILQNGGKQKRQFTHMDDISEAIYQSIMSKKSKCILNIVDDFIITIRQLAVLIKKLCKSKSSIIMDKPRANDPPSSIICSTKALSAIHWKPKAEFNAALISLIKEYDFSKHHI